MSTLTEIREAIGQLNEQDRSLLIAELVASLPEPHPSAPAQLAVSEPSLTDAEADRVYPLEDVRIAIPYWIAPYLLKKRNPEN